MNTTDTRTIQEAVQLPAVIRTISMASVPSKMKLVLPNVPEEDEEEIEGKPVPCILRCTKIWTRCSILTLVWQKLPGGEKN